MSSRGEQSRERVDRAQTETLGVVLLLGITIVGTGLIVGFGGTALDDTRSSTELQRAEHAMTLFDSRSAQVALGDSGIQTIEFGRTEGSYTVEPGAGQITIRHVNWDGGGSTEILYQASLGALVYENDDTVMVYQGGGVWRMGKNGGTSMVSPPEFHFRGATLTLPVVRVTGSASRSGPVTARVKPGAPMEHVFPDVSQTYPDGSSYTNPAEDGKVEVVIESEYYRGWADYFRSRVATTSVSVDHANQKVTATLKSTGNRGDFGMPGEGSSVEVRGVNDHSMDEFSITLRPDDSDSANFANLKWSMYVDEGSTQFEIHVRKSGGSGCSTEASLAIYYSDDGGSSYHGWYDPDAYVAECDDYNGDGDDEVRMVIDLLDDEDGDANVREVEANDPMLEYLSLSSSDLVTFNPGGTPPDPVTISGHPVGWESKQYDLGTGDAESVDRLLNHYFSVMDGFELTVDDKSSDTINEGASHGTIDYTGAGRYITYLHVTENEVVVELE